MVGGSVGRRLDSPSLSLETSAERVLLYAHPRDGPGDHQLLDLFGAFEDVVDHSGASMGWCAVPVSWAFTVQASTR